MRFYKLFAAGGLFYEETHSIHASCHCDAAGDLPCGFAVTSLHAGDDIKTVQANLGHATAQFALDTYGHVTQKMRQDSANRMQHFYEQLRK